MAYIKLGNMGRKRPIQDEEGGSALPEVTSADEGKVLAVNASGEWAAESKVLLINDITAYTWNDLYPLFLKGVQIIATKDSNTYMCATLFTLEEGVYPLIMFGESNSAGANSVTDNLAWNE